MRPTTPGFAPGTAISGAATSDTSVAMAITYILLASAVSGNNMIDNASITSVVMSGQGQIVVTPTYTQT
jgi:hypothetical protein